MCPCSLFLLLLQSEPKERAEPRSANVVLAPVLHDVLPRKTEVEEVHEAVSALSLTPDGEVRRLQVPVDEAHLYDFVSFSRRQTS